MSDRTRLSSADMRIQKNQILHAIVHLQGRDNSQGILPIQLKEHLGFPMTIIHARMYALKADGEIRGAGTSGVILDYNAFKHISVRT
jgi:hypothetical protein